MKVWFDEFELTLGASLRESIDEGLANSAMGLVILSPHFLAKQWPTRELNGFFARETFNQNRILPVYHGITADDVRKISPILADRLAVSSENGLDAVMVSVLQAIRRFRNEQDQWRPYSFEWKHGIIFVVLPIRFNDVALCMCKHPITNEQYAYHQNPPIGQRLKGRQWIDGFEPWKTPGFSEADKPVVCVSYEAAHRYLSNLQRSSISPPKPFEHGDQLSLFIPSPELWDFAALATWTHQTNDPSFCIAQTDLVHHRADAPVSIDLEGDRTNRLGINDMFGNVWEWCANVKRVNPPIFRSSLGLYDAMPSLRGGGFNDDLARTNVFISASILDEPTRTAHFDLGFRLGAQVPLTSLPVEVQAALAECAPPPWNSREEAGIGDFPPLPTDD